MKEQTFSQKEVDKLLSDNAILNRIDYLEQTIHKNIEKQREHGVQEKKDFDHLLNVINKNAKESENRHGDYHKAFVKKSELKLYALLIIFAVTATTGFTAYIAQSTSSNGHEAKIEKILNKLEAIKK